MNYYGIVLVGLAIGAGVVWAAHNQPLQNMGHYGSGTRLPFSAPVSDWPYLGCGPASCASETGKVPWGT